MNDPNIQESIMVEVLRVRYDNFEYYILDGDLSDLKGPISTWWRDLVTSNISVGRPHFDLSDYISYDIGEGTNVTFWSAGWCGMKPLKTIFPHLYCRSGHKNDMVYNMVKWV